MDALTVKYNRSYNDLVLKYTDAIEQGECAALAAFLAREKWIIREDHERRVSVGATTVSRTFIIQYKK